MTPPVSKPLPVSRVPDSVSEMVARRFRAGDSVSLLAWDYDRPRPQIEACIRAWMLAIGKRRIPAGKGRREGRRRG